jgi:virginiamycin B lyase
VRGSSSGGNAAGIGRRIAATVISGALTIVCLLTTTGASFAAKSEPPKPPPVALPSSSSTATVHRLPYPASRVTALVGAPEGGVWFTAANGVPGVPGRAILSLERMDAQGTVSRIAERESAGGFARFGDGSVWITGFRTIGLLTATGVVSEFRAPENEEDDEEERFIVQDAITAGPDGNVWFSSTRQEAGGGPGSAAITRLVPSGQMTEFRLPGKSSSESWASSLAPGSDGRIWFTQPGRYSVGGLAMDGQSVSMITLAGYANASDITAGPEGNLWFSQSAPSALVRLTPPGELQAFPLPAPEPSPYETTSGPDGRVWFTYGTGRIGRIAPNGGFSQVALPDGAVPSALAVGVEGDVWYAAEPANPSEQGIVGRIEAAPLAARILTIGPTRRGRAVRVKVECFDGTAGSICGGALRLRAGRRSAAHRKFALETDSTRTFTVPLSRRAATKLRERRKLRLAATVTIPGSRVAQPLAVKLPG